MVSIKLCFYNGNTLCLGITMWLRSQKYAFWYSINCSSWKRCSII